MAGAVAPAALVSACAARPRTYEASVDVSTVAPGTTFVPSAKGIDDYPILIVRSATGDYTAFSLQCTHMGCPVNAPVGTVLTCPCHGSQFDLAGKVVKGPADAPLGKYHTEYHAGVKRLTVYVEA